MTFLVCLTMLVYILWTSPESRLSRSINKWSHVYNLDRNLVKAIIDVESKGGKDLWRYEPKLKGQEWAWTVVERYGLDPNNRKTWSSCGHMQVLYLSAVDSGFRGSPDDLVVVETNVRWGTYFLSEAISRYEWNHTWNVCVTHGIATYNAGRVRWSDGWKYKNQTYVDLVLEAWTNEKRKR